MRPITILDALRDPDLFGDEVRDPSWRPWVACAATLFGLAATLPPAEQALVARCLGRERLPDQPAREAWLVIGRRGGKSRCAAVVAVFLACLRDYSSILAPGEHGVVMILATDRRQARVVYDYVVGLLDASPVLQTLVVSRTRDAIALQSGITIEIHTANDRSVRGHTVVGAICDEIAFWPTPRAAHPDTAILNALRPSTATVPGALILGLSSPAAKRGVLWGVYQTYYGVEDAPVLVWQADTRTMNPTVPAAIVEEAHARNPVAARAEYGAQFPDDLECVLRPEVLDAVVVPGRTELAPQDECAYVAFVDPSGGGTDSMTLAIAHHDGPLVVLDAVHEWCAPFSPEAVVSECAAVLRRYRIRIVIGDRYAVEWIKDRFRAHGVEYRFSAHTTSDLYLGLIPRIYSKTVTLLDHARLRGQLGGLQRHTSHGGRDRIAPPDGAHDDLATAVAGVVSVPRPHNPQIRHLRSSRWWHGRYPTGTGRLLSGRQFP